MSGKNIFSLAQLNKSINNLIVGINRSFWIKAEIAQLQINGGHAYLELIEKKEDVIIAKNRATIWASELQIFQHRLKSIFSDVIKVGINILVEVSIQYHPVYGLSLQIEDLDESYSIGEFEKIRKENIEKLKNNGAFDLQSKLQLSLVPQKIAVISSKKAAGFEDFLDQLTSNAQSFKFNVTLFSTTVQGEKAKANLVKAIDQIDENEFDCIVIIRGGGAKSDLFVFDDYDFSLKLAQKKCPVLTGIGHERDETITDLVAYSKFKTPTAVANFLIDQLNYFNEDIIDLFDNIRDDIYSAVRNYKNELRYFTIKTLPTFSKKVEAEKYKLDRRFFKIENTIVSKIKNEKNKLKQLDLSVKRVSMKSNHNQIDYLWKSIKNSVKNIQKKEELKISLFESKIVTKDPEELLLKGFSMTLKEGKLVDPNTLNSGDRIQTYTKSAIIESVVDKVEEKL